jgi:hypothetical protein
MMIDPQSGWLDRLKLHCVLLMHHFQVRQGTSFQWGNACTPLTRPQQTQQDRLQYNTIQYSTLVRSIDK